MKINDVEFEIIRSNRKTLAVQVKSGGDVVVRSPKKLSEKIILDFLNQRYDWIVSAVARQKKKAEKFEIDKGQIEALRQRAKAVIPQKVAYWSKVMQLYPSGVKINSARTRFGSCGAKNSLNFSLFLMAYPDEAIDYVVVHELAHIKHKNHQKEFYKLISKYMPDYKQRATLLKNK